MAHLDRTREDLERKLPDFKRKQVEAAVEALAKAAEPEVRTKISNWLSTHPNDLVALLENEISAGGTPGQIRTLTDLKTGVIALTADIDAQIRLVMRSFDEGIAFATTLYSEAASIGSDMNRQAHIFNAVVQSLHDQDDVFEPRRENPPLLAGEQRVPMEYSDHVQTFALSPWNGVPIHTDASGADFNAAVAIPLLDLAGLRVQWSKSRFADLRFAVGGGYTQTEVDGVRKSAFLPNASLGFATLKVGFGLAVGQSEDDFSRRWRVIVGADLYKLITGANVEAL
jgi:hypothetical protein